MTQYQEKFLMLLSQIGSDEERMTFLDWLSDVAIPQASTGPGYANLISGREKLHQVQHFSTHYILTLAGLPTFNASAGSVTQIIIRLIASQFSSCVLQKFKNIRLCPPSQMLCSYSVHREDLRRFCDVLTNLHTFSAILRGIFHVFQHFIICLLNPHIMSRPILILRLHIHSTDFVCLFS